MLAGQPHDKGSLASSLSAGQGVLLNRDLYEAAKLPSLPLLGETADEIFKRIEEKRKEEAARKAAKMDEAMAGLQKRKDEGLHDDAEVRA